MQQAKIRILPDAVANLIAAGEVVERPASVVKELAENAIDAGASHVVVRVRSAGTESIVVEDDGAGMGREDAVLALKRHATSKIADADDLDRIATLGFRGEALPSIAAVSRMTLTTRTADSDEATLLEVENGLVMRCEAAGGAVGTRVEVRDLFLNTPARRKFLKNDATELRNIVETVAQLALIHPAVGFELSSQGRTLLALPPGQSPETRAAEVTGLPAAGLHWSRAEAGERKLAFAFAPPHEGR
ncbi:MAG TPA: DNA mismatch repair endonuclease MutL, partial [Geobacteraceae bacterium]